MEKIRRTQMVKKFEDLTFTRRLIKNVPPCTFLI